MYLRRSIFYHIFETMARSWAHEISEWAFCSKFPHCGSQPCIASFRQSGVLFWPSWELQVPGAQTNNQHTRTHKIKINNFCLNFELHLGIYLFICVWGSRSVKIERQLEYVLPLQPCVPGIYLRSPWALLLAVY